MRAQTSRAEPLGALRADGSRRALHPADVRGRFVRARRVGFALLLAVYVLAPLVKVGGHPAIHLDVAARRFYLLGGTFNAQDFWLVVLLATALGAGLLFVTAGWGRVWCGWACPQTVFLEGLYRPLERLFDGPAERRQRAAGTSWTLARLARTGLKHAGYVGLSLVLSHVALSLFVSARELRGMVLDGPAAHPAAFGWTVAVSLALYLNFAWFREQLCVVLCPYGRLQSALQDADTVTVGYDARRGEPRAFFKRLEPRPPDTGDCVDCRRCVAVCPTGIDIRAGMQLECLACAQCIDACDEVMEKVGRPKGLIRYDSEAGLSGERTRLSRPRLWLYGSLLVASASALGVGLWQRAPLELTLLRSRGVPFVLEGEEVRNQFELHLVNKGAATAAHRLEVEGPPGVTVVLPIRELTLGSLEDARIPLFLSARRDGLRPGARFHVRVLQLETGARQETEGSLLGGGAGVR